jgi:hypothetical protein
MSTDAKSGVRGILRRARASTNGRGVQVIILVLLLIGAGVVSTLRSSSRLFWYDEICTVAVASQGSWEGIRAALAHAADTNPPIFYVIAAACRRIIDDDHLAYRLPSVIGFLGVPLGTFLFVRRRLGYKAALIAGTVPMLTPLFTRYASEARPYALMAGCLSLALVFWQQAYRWRSAVVFGMLLAAATSLHYYAILAIAPFVAAEAVLWMRTRQVRLPVYCALAGASVPLIAFWPLLAHLREYYGAHFWARSGVLNLPGAYNQILDLQNGLGAGVAFTIIAVLAARVISEWNRRIGTSRITLPAEEVTLVLGFVLLPVIAYVLAHVTGSGMNPRYVQPAILGISISTAVLAASAGRRAVLWMTVLVLATVSFQQAYLLRAEPIGRVSEHPELQRILAMARQSGVSTRPVVIASGMAYLPIAYYNSTLPQAARIVYVADPALAVEILATDSVDRALIALAPYTRGDIRGLQEFTGKYSEFLLYSVAGDSRWDWFSTWLRRGGWSVMPLTSGNCTLYMVSRLN